MPARESLTLRTLPIGLASGVKVVRPVQKDQLLTYRDVELDERNFVVGLRRELEATASQFRTGNVEHFEV